MVRKPVAPHQPEEKTLMRALVLTGKQIMAQLRKKYGIAKQRRRRRCSGSSTLSRVMGEGAGRWPAGAPGRDRVFSIPLTCTEIIGKMQTEECQGAFEKQ